MRSTSGRWGQVGVGTGILALVVLFTGSDRLAAQETEGNEIERPEYQWLRQNEDWSVLRDVDLSSSDDPFDPIKYVPLGDDGSFWASFGGHARFRLEAFNDFNFGASSRTGADDNDVYLLSRLWLHTDLHLGEHVRVFAEGKTAHSTDRDLAGGRRAIDVDSIDLQQGFLDLKAPLPDLGDAVLRVGRQGLLFGKQRLVSPLPWGNTARAWDGVRGDLLLEEWTVSGFYTVFAPVQKYRFNDGDRDTNFYGVYATGRVPVLDTGLDLYWLGIDQRGAVFNGSTGGEERHTFGARFFGTCGDSGFDYDLESAYQRGDLGSNDIRAGMISGQVGYTLPDMEGSPRLHVGYDWASGDGSPGGDVGTFNQLFPLGHAYLGYIDTIGRQNIVAFSSGASVKPTSSVTCKLDGHVFRLADNDDAVYNAGGAVIRPGGTSNNEYVGSEVDLTVDAKLDRHTTLLLGYSHFFAGSVLRDSADSEDTDFFYVSVEYFF